MTEQRRNLFTGFKDIFLIIIQCVLIPVLFSFDSRIDALEGPVLIQESKIEEVEKKVDKLDKKVDHLIDLMQENQKTQTDFYKEYAAALEYSKRQLK
jgi:uncharacterized coiled-coil protein SlyX